ncbi:hypothetical protein NQ318_020059 [Aromia moschata]|uniref:Uncharacterized protein n=1 Tax=Aromia moschata TaxID=1265417 RepID=A0AAV8ZBS9_9CUCU|nr:hypothetical protein NQ318_020059 [Aromia moschata]
MMQNSFCEYINIFIRKLTTVLLHSAFAPTLVMSDILPHSRLIAFNLDLLDAEFYEVRTDGRTRRRNDRSKRTATCGRTGREINFPATSVSVFSGDERDRSAISATSCISLATDANSDTFPKKKNIYIYNSGALLSRDPHLVSLELATSRTFPMVPRKLLNNRKYLLTNFQTKTPIFATIFRLYQQTDRLTAVSALLEYKQQKMSLGSLIVSVKTSTTKKRTGYKSPLGGKFSPTSLKIVVARVLTDYANISLDVFGAPLLGRSFESPGAELM